MTGEVVIETRRFGRVAVPGDRVFHFPGLPGFRSAERFAVFAHDRGGLFAWLISLDVPDLAFAVAEPWPLRPDYDPPLERHHLKAVGVETPSDLEILVIANPGRGGVTLNLAAPLLLNPRTRRGVQVILDRGEYDTREPVAEPMPAEETSAREGQAARSEPAAQTTGEKPGTAPRP